MSKIIGKISAWLANPDTDKVLIATQHQYLTAIQEWQTKTKLQNEYMGIKTQQIIFEGLVGFQYIYKENRLTIIKAQ